MQKRLQSLPLKNIAIHDNYWSRYINTVPAGLSYQWDALNDRLPDAEKSYCMHNFKVAAGLEEGEFGGRCFQDSDVAKWLEGVAYYLETNRDPELEKIADEAIEIIGKAQQDDGYLDTYFIVAEPDKRWTNLRDWHELYCAGHFIEAAVAYYNSTGKDRLLKIICRYVDLICNTIGKEEGKIHGYPGHPEIELALVKLYRVTGEKRYLDLAKYFIDERGQQPVYFDMEKSRSDPQAAVDPQIFNHTYYQVHAPIREQDTAEGHAVRNAYLYTGVADVACETGDETLLKTCETIFDNIAEKRMYITGSIGSAANGERFSTDYDLPNHSSYSESCASIALAMFAKRMLEIKRDSKYADVMENALYNTVLAGISLEGNRFFYVNPLEVVPDVDEKNLDLRHVKTERQKWFGCACCPPNIIRTLASLGQYIYSADDENLFVNLYVSNETHCKIGDRDVTVSVRTQYPYGSGIEIKVKTDSDDPFTLALRLPKHTFLNRMTVDGAPAHEVLEKGYLKLKRNWKGETVVSILLDIPVLRIYANPKVRADIGRVTLVKGPVVYCLEEADNGANLGGFELPDDAALREEYDNTLFGGTMTITAEGVKVVDDGNASLYRTTPPKKEKAVMKFVPYCYWNNRGKGEMLVWVRREIK